MTGHLDIYPITADTTVTLVHDTGPSATAQSSAGHARLDLPDLPDGQGATLSVGRNVMHGVLWLSVFNPVNGSVSFAADAIDPLQPQRPAAMQQKPLPPFDPNDLGGLVHTTLPPEQVIPARSREWWKGDLAGVMLKETPPDVFDSTGKRLNNTTPREMVMSFLLHLYPRVWQDKILTAHAERGYTHFHLSQCPMDLVQYVQSWGFWTSFWLPPAPQRNWANGSQAVMEPFLQALIAAGAPEQSIIVMGKELDGVTVPGPTGLDDLIDHVCALCNPVDLPVWLHFNANKPSWQAGVTPEQWWANMKGRVTGCAWQANAYDQAGTMGAHLWDTRVRVGHSARTAAWELRATGQLYGHYTEEQGCLTGWEMICTTRGATDLPPVAGTMGGLRYPDGSTP